VTAVAATACAMMAGAASAATRHATTTSVSVSRAPHWVGAAVRLSSTVKSSSGTPRGTVTFKWGTIKLCTGRLVRGKTSCNVRFGGAGTYVVRAYYSGNATHKASTSGRLRVAVTRSATTTTITNAPNPGAVDVGKSATFHVLVSGPAGTPAASGKVKVTAFAIEFGTPTAAYNCTATLSRGRGSCTTGALASYGIFGYVATYTGNAAHTASASSRTRAFELDVQNVTTTKITAPSPTTSPVTMTADVGTANGLNLTAAAGGMGSVTFLVGTAPGSLAEVAGCINMPLTTFSAATGNTVTCTDTLTAGSYYIEAIYTGDAVTTTTNSGVPAAPNLTIG
jgi:hypothetical protein